ncbi:hypothetical protein JOE44_002176 [Chryseobacterium sp. PvR013]|uniref:PepSY-like domain-containing protein n=1 Tax=Chryseobacterium sp. PvR013 TaxID=2806595 RepID=UPI001AEAAA32|nr:PepSY-like domain-containing protein [Chryseobacterium sp. PvR013]MBP1165292.1 hypothetical protein [Chryseobacterium sp. PvR013]
MKNKILKVFAITVMSFAFTTILYGQRNTKTEDRTVTQSRIPNLVNQNFVNEYPSVVNVVWRGYPKQANNAEWYEYNPSMQSSRSSEYYIAEFTDAKSHLKAVYSKDGKKISVREMVNSDVPDPISYALRNGDYSDWKIAREKEVIYRDTTMKPMKVYKIKVKKGASERELFYSTDGELLKDRVIK